MTSNARPARPPHALDHLDDVVAVTTWTQTFPLPTQALALGDMLIVGRKAYRVVEIATAGRERGSRRIVFADDTVVTRGIRETLHVIDWDAVDAPVEPKSSPVADAIVEMLHGRAQKARAAWDAVQHGARGERWAAARARWIEARDAYNAATALVDDAWSKS